MGTKRAYGSGSITEVRPGVFKLRWRGGLDPITGRYRQHSETFTGSKKAAQRRLGECLSTVQADTTVATVGQLRAAWASAANVSESTMHRYDFGLRLLPDPFWAMRAADVTPPMVAELYRRLLADGVSAQSIRKIYTALSSMFRHAVEWGWVDRNPCRNVRPPSIERRTYVVPTSADLQRMFAIAADKSESQAVWLRLSVATGARRGEVLALRWSDVDLDRGRVSINGSMGRKGRGATKNVQSVRVVALDAGTIDVLRQWRLACRERALACGARLADDWHVVSDEPATGEPWDLTLATKRLGRIATAAGCPGARLHDLRHAHATMLLEAGVSLRTVADRLGHSRVSTTSDIYGHMLPGADEAAAAAFGDLLSARYA